MPAPTPPNPQPGRCSPCARSRASMALTAMTNTSALASPATSRRANQAACDSVTPISATETITTTRPAR